MRRRSDLEVKFSEDGDPRLAEDLRLADDGGADAYRPFVEQQIAMLDRLAAIGRQILRGLGGEESRSARLCRREVRLCERDRDRLIEELRAMNEKRNAGLARRLAELPSPSASWH